MSDTFLTRPEVEHLTSILRRPAQIKALKTMGVEHKVRPDGSVAILRAHIHRVFGGSTDAASAKREKASAPNWAGI